MHGYCFSCHMEHRDIPACVPSWHWPTLLLSLKRFLWLRQVRGYSQLNAYQCSWQLNSFAEFSTPYVKQLKWKGRDGSTVWDRDPAWLTDFGVCWEVRSQPELIFPMASCCGYFPSAAGGELHINGTLARDRAGSMYCTEDLTKWRGLELAGRARLARYWLSFCFHVDLRSHTCNQVSNIPNHMSGFNPGHVVKQSMSLWLIICHLKWYIYVLPTDKLSEVCYLQIPSAS